METKIRSKDDTNPLLSPNASRYGYKSSPSRSHQKPRKHHRCCGGMLPSNPNKLLQSRQRSETCNIIHKAILLLISPRTILVQLESWLCIYLVILYDSDGHITENYGTAIDISVITFFIAFCVIFAIGQSFARRERALQDIAVFKSNLVQSHYIFCEVFTEKHDKKKRESLLNIFKNLLAHLDKYISDTWPLLDHKLYSEQQNVFVQYVYSDINRLTQIAIGTDVNFQLKETLHHFTPLTAILCSKINALLTSFERIKAVKDYRAPLGIRAFSSMMLWFLPIITAPYFVWKTNVEIHEPNLSCYGWSWLFFLMFGVLVDVKNILDDPFDGDSTYDDILLDEKTVIENIKQGQNISVL